MGAGVLGRGLHDDLAELEDALGVSGGLLFGADLFFFAFDGRGVFDILDAVGQQVDLGIQIADVAGELFAPGEEGLPAGMGPGIGGAFPA